LALPLRRGVGDHFQAMPPESTSVPLRPRPSRVADHLPDPAATSNPFKLIERRLRVLRRQIEYQLACRRLRIGASKVRPAAIAAAYEASPPLDVIGICSEEGSLAVDRVIAFLHRLRDQQLAVGSVRLVASDAVLEDLRQQIAGTLVRPADGRTLLVSGISVDTSATNLLRPLQAAVSASCSQMLAVCDVAGVWDEDASLWLAASRTVHPAAEAIYADHLDLAADGSLRPDHKPDFSWSHLLARPFTGPLIAYDRGRLAAAIDRLIARAVQPATGRAALYAIALESLRGLGNDDVLHIRHPLSTIASRSPADVVADDLPSMAVTVLAGQGIEAMVRHGEGDPGRHEFEFRRGQSPQDAPTVSILIPTKNAGQLVRTCVESLRANAGYERYEITIIDHDSDEPLLASFLDAETAAGRLRVFPYSGPFNYAAMHNAAIRSTDGEWILLLNNDVEGFSPNWLDQMLATTRLDPKIGAVGALLSYPDGDIQHAGVVFTARRPCIPAHNGLPKNAEGYSGRIRTLQEFSAVTAAMMLLRRSAFEQVGGFDEVFPDDYNDIDLCLKLRQAGFRIVYTPHVRATHWESRTRRVKETAKDVYLARWGQFFANDPFYSPHLSPTEFAPDAFEHLWRERKLMALSALASRTP
jgi:GT2 family glycosyltransferase